MDGMGPHERSVRWTGSAAAACCARAAVDEVGLFDEAFALYGEELDIATRLRETWAGRSSTRRSVEIVHEIGVSTGRSREMLRMHSDSIYRYYRKHRAAGWRRATLPAAWAALRLRAELEAQRGRLTTR